ncbi:hypothetical protein DEU44_3430 [Priestia megaterium]|nr:hypothetical protein DEU44_3430 [Priestia megaterium]
MVMVNVDLVVYLAREHLYNRKGIFNKGSVGSETIS